MKHTRRLWRDDGVPKDVPLMITEDALASSLAGRCRRSSEASAGRQCGVVLEAGGAFTHQLQGVQKQLSSWLGVVV